MSFPPFLLLRSGWLRRTFSRVSTPEDEYEKEMELLFHHSQSHNFPSFLIRIFLPPLPPLCHQVSAQSGAEYCGG